MGRKLIRHSVYSIVYAMFVLLVVLPVGYTLFEAMFSDGTLYQNLQLINNDILMLLAKSALIAAAIALLSTLFGTLFGFLLYKTRIRFRGLLKIAFLVPLFISPYILAVAWKDLFFLLFDSTDIISSTLGVILVMTTVFTPLSMIIIGSAFSNIDAQLEESGLLISGFRKTMFKIVLPLIKPALVTSFVLIFIFGISEFSVPAIFGVRVFTTEIFTQFSAFYNHSLAMLQSTMLIFLCILLLLTERKYIADAPFFSVGGKGKNNRIYRPGKNGWVNTMLIYGWLFITFLLPFVMLLVHSFRDGSAAFLQAFNLLKPTFADSIGLAFSAALIIVFIGFIVAYYSEMENKKSLIWFLLVVFTIPSIVLGISLIKFYNRPILDFIYSGYLIIIIGYMGKFSFISAKVIANAIKQIPRSLEEAALIEGIGFYKRLRDILVPLIMPALFAVFIISFIFTLGELGLTIMLYPPGTEIMSIKVFTIMANAPQALISSMTLIVFSITLLAVTAMYLIIKPLIKNYSYADD